MRKVIIGIDEVGRGPLAGPVMVGAVAIAIDFDWNLIPGVRDSKLLTAKKRQVIYMKAKELSSQGLLTYAVGKVDASQIDKVGIVPAIRKALSSALAQLVKESKLKPELTVVKLDGGLKAPEEYIEQETIIKGDQKETVIGLASIIAKVTRDTYMEELATKEGLAGYGFAEHKGYGTKKHQAAIVKYGLSKEHRASFCHFDKTR